MEDLRVCKFCGKTYDRKKQGGTKYCSETCLKAAVKKNAREYYSPVRKEVEYVCPVCGKSFKSTHYRAKYCSNRCQDIAYQYRTNVKRRVNSSIGTKVERTCIYCHKTFEAEDNMMDVCSMECYYKVKTQTPDGGQVACVVCGKMFTPKGTSKKCCSVECSKKHYRELSKRSQKERMKKARKEIKVCLICGKEFVYSRASKNYCSKECARRAKIKRASLHRKNDPQERKCKKCGKTFMTVRRNQVFCSDECRERYTREDYYRLVTKPRLNQDCPQK